MIRGRNRMKYTDEQRIAKIKEYTDKLLEYVKKAEITIPVAGIKLLRSALVALLFLLILFEKSKECTKRIYNGYIIVLRLNHQEESIDAVQCFVS